MTSSTPSRAALTSCWWSSTQATPTRRPTDSPGDAATDNREVDIDFTGITVRRFHNEHGDGLALTQPSHANNIKETLAEMGVDS
jgi:hypothetical protein